jgi:hypothetical protein
MLLNSRNNFSEKRLFIKTKDLNFSNNKRTENSSKIEKRNMCRLNKELINDYLMSPIKTGLKHFNHFNQMPEITKKVSLTIGNDTNEIILTSKNEMQKNFDSLLKSMTKSFIIREKSKSKVNSKPQYSLDNIINLNSPRVTRDRFLIKDYYKERVNYLTKGIWEKKDSKPVCTVDNSPTKDYRESVILPTINSIQRKPKPVLVKNTNECLNIENETKISKEEYKYNCKNHRNLYCCYNSIFSN